MYTRTLISPKLPCSLNTFGSAVKYYPSKSSMGRKKALIYLQISLFIDLLGYLGQVFVGMK